MPVVVEAASALHTTLPTTIASMPSKNVCPTTKPLQKKAVE